MDSSFQFQSSLGNNIKQTDSDDFIFDSIVYGKITKVNYQYGTVEVSTRRTYAGRIDGDDGKYSVPFPKQFSGFTPEGRPFGDTPLIMVGSIVLLGFIEGKGYDPIILNTYSKPEMNNMLSPNVLESGDIANESIYKYGSMMFSIYPSLNYSFQNGNGTIVRSFNGKSFLSITSENDEKEMATDFEQGTEYDSLFSSHYGDNSVIEPRQQKAPNILLKHQGLFDRNLNPDNHITSLYIDENGTLRCSLLDKESKYRTFFEIDNKGNQKVKVQYDNINVDEGNNFIEYGINKEYNTFYIYNGEHKFEFAKTGLLINGVSYNGINDKIQEQLDMINEVKENLAKVDKLSKSLDDVVNNTVSKGLQENREKAEETERKAKEIDENLNKFMKEDYSKTSKNLEDLIKNFNNFVNITFHSNFREKVFNPFYLLVNEKIVEYDDYIAKDTLNKVTRDEEYKRLKGRVDLLENENNDLKERTSSLEQENTELKNYIEQRKNKDTQDITTLENLSKRVQSLESKVTNNTSETNNNTSDDTDSTN